MGNELKNKSVLVIDDDERVLTALECLLEKEGYETTTAWSGREGMNLLRSRSFDLVLLDDFLWDMDPIAILQEVRRTSISSLLMLSEGAPTPADRKRYAEQGASSMVAIDASCNEIAAAVRECLEQQAPEKVPA